MDSLSFDHLEFASGNNIFCSCITPATDKFRIIVKRVLQSTVRNFIMKRIESCKRGFLWDLISFAVIVNTERGISL